MAKKIIRELIIMLLLCIAVILLFGVVLYAYTPGNKTMPEKVSYTIPADVKKELEEDASGKNSQVILTYQIDSNDLTNYQRTKDYTPGKPNPFSSYKPEEKTNSKDSNTTNTGTSSTTTGTTTNTTSSTTTNITTTNSTTSSSTTNTNTKTDSSDTSPYTHDKGTK